MKLVYIEWIDAISNSSWFTQEDATQWAKEDDYTVAQVGWILEENKKYLVLAGRQCLADAGTDEKWGMLQKIPKTWIKKRIVLDDKIEG